MWKPTVFVVVNSIFNIIKGKFQIHVFDTEIATEEANCLDKNFNEDYCPTPPPTTTVSTTTTEASTTASTTSTTTTSTTTTTPVPTTTGLTTTTWTPIGQKCYELEKDQYSFEELC